MVANEWTEYGVGEENEPELPSYPLPEYEPYLRYAGLYARLTAASIDMMVFLVPSVWVSLLFMQDYADANRLTPPDSAAATQAEMLQWMLDAGIVEQTVYSMCLHFVLFAFFSGICWQIWRTTPGKWLMKMRVLRVEDGSPISALQGWQRAVGYVMSWLPCFLGFFWAWTNKRRRCFHDLLAGTVVVVNKNPKNKLITKVWGLFKQAVQWMWGKASNS